MSYDILLSLLKFVNFWRLQGHLSILAKIGCLQKIKVFSMKEQQDFDATGGGGGLGSQITRLYDGTIFGGCNGLKGVLWAVKKTETEKLHFFGTFATA